MGIGSESEGTAKPSGVQRALRLTAQQVCLLGTGRQARALVQDLWFPRSSNVEDCYSTPFKR